MSRAPLARRIEGAAWVEPAALAAGLVRRDALVQGQRAAGRLAQAEHAAAQLRAQAEAAARQCLDDARAAAADRLAEAEREAAQRADAAVHAAQAEAMACLARHEAALRAAHAACRAALQDQVLPLLARAVSLVAGELCAPQRLAATVAQLFDEAGTPPGAVLLVHESDLAQVQALEALPWPVRAEPGLAQGACRLSADAGDWASSYDARLAAVLAAFAPVPASAAGTGASDTTTQPPAEGTSPAAPFEEA